MKRSIGRPDAALISNLEISNAFNQLFAQVSPRSRLYLADQDPTKKSLVEPHLHFSHSDTDSGVNDQIRNLFQLHSQDDFKNTTQESHATCRQYRTTAGSVHHMLQDMKKRHMNTSISSFSSAVFSSCSSCMSDVDDGSSSVAGSDGNQAVKNGVARAQVNVGPDKRKRSQELSKPNQPADQDRSTQESVSINQASEQSARLIENGSLSAEGRLRELTSQVFDVDNCVTSRPEPEWRTTIIKARKSLRLQKKRSGSLPANKEDFEEMKNMGKDSEKATGEDKNKTTNTKKKNTTNKENTINTEKLRERVMKTKKVIESSRGKQTEEKRQTRKKASQPTTKDIKIASATILTDWIIKPMPECQGVCVEGKKNDMEDFWHSTAVSTAITSQVVQTVSGSIYRLEGPINKLCTIDNGFSKEVAKAFAKGFPTNWKNIIHSFYKDLRTRNPVVPTPPVYKPGNKRKPQKPETPTSKLETEVIANPLCDESIITPAGLLKQNMTEADLIVTRSGRISLPPLARWAGQHYAKIPGRKEVQIQFETNFAKQAVSQETKQVLQIPKRFQKMISYHKSLSNSLLTSSDSRSSFHCPDNGKGNMSLPANVQLKNCRILIPKLLDTERKNKTKNSSESKSQNRPDNKLDFAVSGNVTNQNNKTNLCQNNDGSRSKVTKNKSRKNSVTEICASDDFQSEHPENRVPKGDASDLTDLRTGTMGVKRGSKGNPKTNATLSKSDRGNIGNCSKMRESKERKDEAVNKICPRLAEGNITVKTKGKSGLINKDQNAKSKQKQQEENCLKSKNSGRRQRGKTQTYLSSESHRKIASSQSSDQQIDKKGTRKKGEFDLRENLLTPDKQLTPIGTKLTREGTKLTLPPTLQTDQTVTDKEGKLCGSDSKTLSVCKNSEGKVSKSRKRKVSPQTESQMSSSDRDFCSQNKRKKTEDTGRTTDWTKTETDLFDKALREVSGVEVEYWSKISAIVGTRTDVECQEFHKKSLEDKDKAEEQRRSKSKKPEKQLKKTGVNVRQKGEPIRGGKGTLKRKADLRDLLDELNEGHEDDLFQGSPYLSRQPTTSIFAVNFDKDDSEVFGSNHNFFTPVAGKRTLMSPGTRPRASIASVKRTPAFVKTNVTPVSVNRREADRYIKHFVDRKRKQDVGDEEEKEVTPDLDLESSVLPIRSLFSPVGGPSILLDGSVNVDEEDDKEAENSPYMYYWDDALED